MRKPTLLFTAIILSTFSFAQRFGELSKEVANNRSLDDEFGTAVAINGTYSIVGNPYQDTDNGNANPISDAGAATILELDTLTLTTVKKSISTNDRVIDDNFGYTVGISGNYAIVGAPGQDYDTTGSNLIAEAGAAYIFERDTAGNWTEVIKLVDSDRAANDGFGFSVAIDGDYAIVGAWEEEEDAANTNTLSGAGSAFIYKRDVNGEWGLDQKIVPADRAAGDNFGNSVSISRTYAIIGSPESNGDGAAYVFEYDGTDWNQVVRVEDFAPTSGDRFGSSVSIDGEYAVVGAPEEDHDEADNNTVVRAGSAFIFYRDNGVWSFQKKIIENNRQQDDKFGTSVAIDGHYVIVGAIGDNNPANDQGAAFVFKRTGINWTLEEQIIASDGETDDEFGRSVAISGEYAIVGAPFEDDGASTDAGAAYLFRACRTVIVELNGGALVANIAGTSYQWFTCSGTILTPVSGETSQSFTPTSSGNYAIAVTGNGCIDTSACVAYNVGIAENTSGGIMVYPNPSNGMFNLSSISKLNEATLIVLDITGKKIFQTTIISGTNFMLDLSQESNGIYFIEISDKDSGARVKIIKQ